VDKVAEVVGMVTGGDEVPEEKRLRAARDGLMWSSGCGRGAVCKRRVEAEGER
jgi:hypothetical protein